MIYYYFHIIFWESFWSFRTRNFFEVPPVAIDFPELREQIKDIEYVKLIDSRSSIRLIVKEFLISRIIKKNKINIEKKILQLLNNIKNLIQ